MSHSITSLPGPRGLPVLGNVLQIKPSRLHITAEKWCQLYGPLFRFNIGRRPVIVVSDQETITSVLRDRPEGFRRWHEVEDVLGEMGITGVFSAEGQAWREQRRFAITALNSSHLRRYFEVIQTATERLYKRLSEAARAGQPVAIADYLRSYTVDVTSALAFGNDLNTLGRGSSELRSQIEQVFQRIAQRISAPFPYWRSVRLPVDRALDRALAKLHVTVNTFVEQAQVRMRENPELFENPENFLESMLAANKDGEIFDSKELFGNVLTMLLAGEETTANTLAWTVWFLAKTPDVQAQLAAESQELLGESTSPATYDTVTKMTYGEAVIREALRLKSPAPVVLVESLKETEIAGVSVPANTRLLLLTRYTSERESSFRQPSEFNPGRWLDESDATQGPNGSLAFGAGPRFCPGRNLAFLEAKAAMSMLTRNFEIELDHKAKPVKEIFNFTMSPSPVHVRLRESTTIPPA